MQQSINQWNKIKESRNKTSQWGKNSFFNKRCWDKWISTYKRMKLDSHFTTHTHTHTHTHTQSKSKRIKNLNVKGQTIKFLEENTAANLNELGNSFLNITPKHKQQKKK